MIETTRARHDKWRALDMVGCKVDYQVSESRKLINVVTSSIEDTPLRSQSVVASKLLPSLVSR